jgi:predicted DNA-binding transcriptional regulator YafY
MANDRRRIVITRLMQLAVVLHETKRGLTVRQLMQRLECGKSTVHRDIKSLGEVGIRLDTERVVGEVRYSLAHWPIAAVAPTPLQLAALCLAREALDMFDGTEAVEQLEQLLAQWGRLPRQQLTLKYQKRGKQSGSLVGTIDRAITKQQRLAISYQGERDSQFKQRKVEPIELRASGEQLYLFAYDVERQDYRVFKAARMAKALVLAEPSADHSRVDVDGRFSRAVKTWTANTPTPVVVRVSAQKARFVAEYPLITDQVVTALPDGSVQISAEVNGITEALNWVLSWGAHAEAVSPPELREQAAAELREAAAKYGPPRPTGTGVRKTNGRQSMVRGPSRQANDAQDQVVSRELGRRGSRVG